MESMQRPTSDSHVEVVQLWTDEWLRERGKVLDQRMEDIQLKPTVDWHATHQLFTAPLRPCEAISRNCSTTYHTHCLPITYI